MAIAYYDIAAIIIIIAFLVLRFRFDFASRSIVVLALAFLLGAALLSGLGDHALANELTIIAFYLLATGIALLTFDHFKETKGPVSENRVVNRYYNKMKGLLDRLRS